MLKVSIKSIIQTSCTRIRKNYIVAQLEVLHHDQKQSTQKAGGPETESSRATHPRNHSSITRLVGGEVNVISSTPRNETVPGMAKLGLVLIPNS